MNGVKTDSEVGRQEKDFLLQYNDTASLPDPVGGRGRRFYMDYYDFLKSSGIDFVKVDNQAGMIPFVENRIPISAASYGELDNQQQAAEKYFSLNVINCMDMGIDVVYYWWGSNVGRSSTDYSPGKLLGALGQVHKNVKNALWFSQLAYPDYDEFQSYNKASKMMAVAHAMSGGPVYFSDEAGKENFAVLWPLIFSDGKILRPDRPSLPTIDSLFEDPRETVRPLKHFARIGNGGALAAYNVNLKEMSVSGSYSPSDIYGMEGKDFAVFEYFSGKLERMSVAQKNQFSLGGNGVKLWIMEPISDGFAAVGLVNKYISCKAILSESLSSLEARIGLYEGGKFLAYSESKPRRVLANAAEIPENSWNYKGNRLDIDLSQFKGEKVELEIIF
jgi:hypothetical protein